MVRHPAVPAALEEDVYRRALEVGRRAAGVSGPNPPVGCVLLRDGAVVGEGSTRAVGSAHAEVVALAEAGERAAGATAVVTLEPCAHVGRTHPCVDALVAAGVTEVHVLLRDPDPAAAGGVARLIDAGISVLDVGEVRPDLQALAAHDLRGFLARVRSSRPHVTLKLAQDPDGVTSPPPGGYLTGIEARRHVHGLRADVDAVLVGGSTLRTDDPLLDVRHVAAARQPRAVVLSGSGDVPATARALRPGAIVVVADDVLPAALAGLSPTGARVLAAPLTVATPPGLDVAAALRLLLDERVLTVLAEPGPRLAAALLAAGAVDVIELHVAGGAAAGSAVRPALAGLAPLLSRPGSSAAPDPTAGTVLDLDGDVESTTTADGDLLLRAAVARTLERAA